MRRLTLFAPLLTLSLVCFSCNRSKQSQCLTDFTKAIAWCVPPGSDLRFSRQCTPTETEYIRPSEASTFLDTPVKAVGYYFVKDQLRSIRFYVAPEHSVSFRQQLFKAFGPVTEPGEPLNWFASDDRTMALLFPGKTTSSDTVLDLSFIPGQRRRAGVDAP